METPKQRGFTLIELMVTLVVLVILIAVAVPNLRSFLDRSKFDAAQQDLISSLSLARVEAVKRGKPVLLLAQTAGASQLGRGWRVFVEDENSPGEFTSGATVVSQQLQVPGEIVMGGGTGATFKGGFEGVRFDVAGNPITSSGAVGNQKFPLRFERDATVLLKGVLCISVTGRIRYVNDKDYSSYSCD
jgi:prepilin-type N-terminal cleavage/methylation domain-containing protein